MPFIELDFPREVLEIGSHGKSGGRYLVRNWDELDTGMVRMEEEMLISLLMDIEELVHQNTTE